MWPILIGGLWALGTTAAFATKNPKVAYSMAAVGVITATAFALAKYSSDSSASPPAQR